MPAAKPSSRATPRAAASTAAKAGPKAAAPFDPPRLRFRIRVTCGDVIAIGPGKIALLEAVEQTGSITAAARHLDMSYRRAWLLLDELNRSLRAPAIGTAKGGPHGGGSALTAEGRKLVALYRRIEATAAQAGRSDIRKMLRLLAAPA